MGRSKDNRHDGLRPHYAIVDEIQDWANDTDLDDLIEHHGVRGMHWGVRRSRAQLDAASEDFKKASEHKETIKTHGGTHALQNNELQFVITRLNLEQQYSRLTEQPSQLKQGQKVIKEVLGVGKTIQEVHSFVNSPLGKSVKSQLKKK